MFEPQVNTGSSIDSTVFLKGIAEVIDRYDGLIVDLWGVVHNGVAPYPGVLSLQQIAHTNRKDTEILVARSDHCYPFL